MTNQHPITPPPELVTDWCGQLARENDYGPTCVYDIATQAAQWGADQERARAALAQPEPQGPSDEDLDALFTEVDQSGESESWRTYARAALARWGRPAIEPVPVSERLPGPEDCDEEGLCWWWDSDCRQTEAWCRGLSEYASGSYSHWLPHWALPVPGVEGADA
jgi:hypothetical protein